MSKIIKKLFLYFIIPIILPGEFFSLSSEGTRLFILNSQKQLAAGKMEGMAVSSKSRILMGPQFNLLHQETGGQVPLGGMEWNGGVVFSTNQGDILHLKEGKSQILGKLDRELPVAFAEFGGRLIVGSAASGRVMASTANGFELLVEVESKRVLALAARGDELVIGCGSPARIQSLRAGKLKTLCEVHQQNVTQLTLADKKIYFGTDEGGVVYELPNDGTPRALYHSPFEEIRGLIAREEGLYALVSSFKKGKAIPDKRPDAPPPTKKGSENGGKGEGKEGEKDKGGAPEGSAPDITPPPSSPDNLADEVIGPDSVDFAFSYLQDNQIVLSGEEKEPQSELVKITPEGFSETLFQLKVSLQGLVGIEEGQLIIAGRDGRMFLYRCSDRELLLIHKLPHPQVSGLILGKGGPIVLTGKGPTLYKMEAGGAGVYRTPVIDFEGFTRLGKLEVKGKGELFKNLRLKARVGFSRDNRSGWEEWRPVDLTVDEAGDKFASLGLSGKFLQFKMESDRPTAGRIEEFRIFHHRQNRPPRFTQCQIFPLNIFLKGAPPRVPQIPVPSVGLPEYLFGGENQKREKPQPQFWRGTIAVSFKAEDPDEDDLTYDIQLQPRGASQALTLVKNHNDTVYNLEGRNFPDGFYKFVVTAIDATDNGIGERHTATIESREFRLDLTPPQWSRQASRFQGGQWELDFSARDTVGIEGFEYSDDGEKWFPLEPEDGVLDEPEESVRLRLPGHPSSLWIRALDGALNSCVIQLHP